MECPKERVILALIFVLTGSINTLSIKFANQMTAKGSDGVERDFNHPFVQALVMFTGEILCLIVFQIILAYHNHQRHEQQDHSFLVKGNHRFNKLLLVLPALCDMLSTSLMYIGLVLTTASSFQMFRGAVIVFVAGLSRIFLGRRFGKSQISGILIIIVGLCVIGYADFMVQEAEKSTGNEVLGDIIIVVAQLMVSIQMVVEEKYIAGLDIAPMQAVGWEGVYGFITLSILLVPMYYVEVPPPYSNNAHNAVEDVPDAWAQAINNKLILGCTIVTVISIAFFNFAGVSITKQISSTTRMVMDSARTCVVWIIAFAAGLQTFVWLQPIGFVILAIGMFLYQANLPGFE